MNLNQIAEQIQSQIRKSCNVDIEWTFRSGTEFTICGNCVDVNKAVLFCLENKLCQMDGDTVYDKELDTSFAYLRTF